MFYWVLLVCGVRSNDASIGMERKAQMTLEDFIKEQKVGSLTEPWVRIIWQSAHAEGEKVGWEKALEVVEHPTSAAVYCNDWSDFCRGRNEAARDIRKAIGARKDK